jgi:uncharacterized protein (TIGR02001 family)
MRFCPTALLLSAALLASAPAVHAQEEESWPQISGSATFTTDYRFRGISLSDKDPAVQAGIELATKPGFFVGIWGSSIATVGQTVIPGFCTLPGEGVPICTPDQVSGGSNAEIDIYGGWAGAVGPVDTSIGILAYLYPGGSGVDYYELYGTVGGSFGPAELTVGLNIAPNQGNLSRSNRYVFGALNVGIPNTPLTFKTSIGHERGSLVIDGTGRTTNKFDYMVGVDVTWKALTLSGAFHGNDLPDKRFTNDYATNKFVVSLSAGF